jgi:hypothetical protein
LRITQFLKKKLIINSYFFGKKITSEYKLNSFCFLPNLTETSDSLSTKVPAHLNFEMRAKPCCGSAAVSADGSDALPN